MKVLRAFQVINKDGAYAVSSTYNEIDGASGELKRANVTDSFYAMDRELQSHIDAIEDYIKANRLGKE